VALRLIEFFRQVLQQAVWPVVILRLSPDFESKLAQVLQTERAIPVMQVLKKVQVGPSSVS
jgi:hypothetical protein